MNSRRHSGRVVVAMVLGLAAPAVASPLDILGLGSRHAGQANAGIAAVDDASALYYNPAGLVSRPACTPPIRISPDLLPPELREELEDAKTRRTPRTEREEAEGRRITVIHDGPRCPERDRGDVVMGVTGAYSHLAIDNLRAPFADAGGAQLAARARIGDRFALAFAFHGPSQGGEHAVVRAPAYPLYPYYRDRLSRPVLLVGAGADLGSGTALGASADLGAGTAHPKAILGGTYRFSEALRFGLAYHQRFAIIDETTGARVHYTPHTVLAGVTFVNDAVRASLDIGFAHWSAYEGPFATGTSVRVPYTSSELIRFGIESNKEDGVSFRFGYALETAAIPEEQADANLLDGTKQLVAGGASYGAGRVRVDAHIGIQIVSTRTMENPDSTKLKSGGEVFTGGLTLALGY